MRRPLPFCIIYFGLSVSCAQAAGGVCDAAAAAEGEVRLEAMIDSIETPEDDDIYIRVSEGTCKAVLTVGAISPACEAAGAIAAIGRKITFNGGFLIEVLEHECF